MTKQTEYTPGPWRPFYRAGVIEVQEDPPNRPAIVSWLGFDDCLRSKSEHLANARLIAAAPELLEACEYALDAMSGPDGPPATQAEKMAMRKLRAAIAKAKMEATDD